MGLNNPIISNAQPAKYYPDENGDIVGKNNGYYNNRPLYVNNSNAFILAGDQPVARLAKDQYMYGIFMLAIERNNKSKWLQQCDKITSIYRSGRIAWEITDKDFPDLKVKLEILPMAKTTGMAVRLTAEGANKGEKLIWAFGGAQWLPGQDLAWRLDVTRNADLLNWEFVPSECKNNKV